ncbi:hypothetical protein I4U23_022102 [Adineta vaga]|nr:hypothetical protein I4U23_022102 [Adineta vaga]
MNDISMIDSNNGNQKQIETNGVVMHQPPPLYTPLNTSSIPYIHSGQSIVNCQYGYNMPIMTNNGTRIINNGMTSQIVNVPEYRTWSILNILFCFFILGIFACMKSEETRNRKCSGDLQGALKSSKSTKILNIFGTILGTIIIATISILAATKTIKFYSD